MSERAYKGPWAFVGYAYDDLSSASMKRRVREAFYRAGNSSGDLEALYRVMKACGHDFGADDPEGEPRPVMMAGAIEYEEILAGQEIMDGTQ